MGPTDTNWRKLRAVVDGEDILLHECGGASEDAMFCADEIYMFWNRIEAFEMYTNPVHLAHSHTAI